MAPNRAGRIFPTNPDLADILGRTDLDSETFRKPKVLPKIAARALATYLIPGCVGKGVRLGSESSSAAATAGGVWKSGNLEIWDLGNLEIWGPGNPEIWRSGNLEIQ